jgi:hypothetical protein
VSLDHVRVDGSSRGMGDQLAKHARLPSYSHVLST